MNSITITITQPVEIAGFIVDVRDTSVLEAYLRRYVNDDATGDVNEYGSASLGDGQFNFSYDDGNMQLWKSELPDTTASNRIDSWHGAPNKTRWLGDKDLPYITLTELTGAIDTLLYNLEDMYYPTSDDPLVFTDTHLTINDASDGTEPTSLQQVTTLIAQVQTPPFGDRVIRVVPDALQEIEGQVYQDIFSAVAYAVSEVPNFDKQFTIQIDGMGANQFLLAAAGCLKQYVNIVAAGRHISIIFAEPTLTLTNPMTIENATIYFGGNDVITDRVFSKVNLKNVICYHYRDITFNNSDIIHSRVAGFDTKILKYGGTTNLDYVSLKNEPTKLGGHSGAENYTTFGYIVPADPSELPGP